MENEFAVMDDEAEDFYQLLGVVRPPALRLYKIRSVNFCLEG